MPLRFGFKAHDITTKVVDTFTEANSSVVITTPMVIDPISDAVNNVRFAVNGFAADGAFGGIELRTRSFFTFNVPAPSTIRVRADLTFFGLSSLTGRKQSWFFDRAGFAAMNLKARMRVRIQRGNTTVATFQTAEKFLFAEGAEGSSFTRTNTDTITGTLLENFLALSPPDIVLPSDDIHVRVQYNMNAFAFDGGEFVVDFDATDIGLNVPMVTIRSFE